MALSTTYCLMTRADELVMTYADIDSCLHNGDVGFSRSLALGMEVCSPVK